MNMMHLSDAAGRGNRCAGFTSDMFNMFGSCVQCLYMTKGLARKGTFFDLLFLKVYQTIIMVHF